MTTNWPTKTFRGPPLPFRLAGCEPTLGKKKWSVLTRQLGHDLIPVLGLSPLQTRGDAKARKASQHMRMTPPTIRNRDDAFSRGAGRLVGFDRPGLGDSRRLVSPSVSLAQRLTFVALCLGIRWDAGGSRSAPEPCLTDSSPASF